MSLAPTHKRSRRQRTSSRPDLPGPRRRNTNVAPLNLTIDALRSNRGQLVGTSDVIVIGIVSSYMALRRLMIAGLFPPAKRLPSGYLCWEAGQIVDWYDALPGPALSPVKSKRRIDSAIIEETGGQAKAEGTQGARDRSKRVSVLPIIAAAHIEQRGKPVKAPEVARRRI